METILRALCWIAFLVLLTCIPRGSAQDSSCLNKVSPCLNYLNGTEDPPDSCCEPLKSVIESDAECLCSLVSNRGTRQAEQAGININEAQQLPGRCGQHVNPLSCLTNSPGPTNSDRNSATKLVHVSSGIVMMILFFSIIAHV
ncbi:lipid transfer-like protein VAS [Glycine soja]|uniref:Lipid transfer-like protein VAS n=1 Tax=Glycine soja TaxID=3848 RepID=A0A0B2PW92_GLYSO|nr:lipid transfer-like protein VAS [Glycine soja]KHN13400.1 Lipid transfer-like protein VAS [Glycine soja]RZB61128.1 Lipid transfer-like protein VAS [Glycine soja]